MLLLRQRNELAFAGRPATVQEVDDLQDIDRRDPEVSVHVREGRWDDGLGGRDFRSRDVDLVDQHECIQRRHPAVTVHVLRVGIIVERLPGGRLQPLPCGKECGRSHVRVPSGGRTAVTMVVNE